MVDKQFNVPLKALQTDWGGKFRPLTNFLKQEGMIHRIICPLIHDQNSLVERKHRHIVEVGLTLLAQASLPYKYWDHAFLTSFIS